jgi:hypothetical protein
VFQSHFVGVGDDADFLATKILVVFRPPPTSTVGIRRGNETHFACSIDILFAFGDYDAVSLLQLVEAVRDAPCAIEVVNPPAVAIGPPGLESFRFVSDNLVQQLADFVGVVIFRDDSRPVTVQIQVRPVEPCGCQDVDGFAFGKTVKKNLPVGDGNRETRVIVVVRRARSLPPRRRLLDVVKFRQNFRDTFALVGHQFFPLCSIGLRESFS